MRNAIIVLGIVVFCFYTALLLFTGATHRIEPAVPAKELDDAYRKGVIEGRYIALDAAERWLQFGVNPNNMPIERLDSIIKGVKEEFWCLGYTQGISDAHGTASRGDIAPTVKWCNNR